MITGELEFVGSNLATSLVDAWALATLIF